MLNLVLVLFHESLADGINNQFSIIYLYNTVYSMHLDYYVFTFTVAEKTFSCMTLVPIS